MRGIEPETVTAAVRDALDAYTPTLAEEWDRALAEGRIEVPWHCSQSRRELQAWRDEYWARSIALGLSRRDGVNPSDYHAVEWDSDAGRQMDEIDAVIEAAT